MEKNTEKVKLNDEQLDNGAGGYEQNQSSEDESPVPRVPQYRDPNEMRKPC